MSASKKSRRDLYQETTDRIVGLIESGDVLPWRKPWRDSVAARFAGGSGEPRNAVSGRPYRGANVALAFAGFEDPRWLTFKQAKDLGGSVRKGEQGSLVTFWKFFESKEVGDDGKPKRIPMLRHFVCFNVEQCDGLELPELPGASLLGRELPTLERCEAVLKGMPQRPALFRNALRAFYRPSSDSVHMPAPEAFDRLEDWYHVAFHEFAHATGHESRLNRSTLTQAAAFGSELYAEEELVAELASAMVGRVVGIDPVLGESAGYCAGWAKRLKDDPKLWVRAAGRAQRAADAILGREVA